LLLNAIYQVVCCDTGYSTSKRGAMFETAVRISLATSVYERYFLFITATAEHPASHKHEVAKWD